MYLKWSWGIKLRVLHMLGTHLAPSPPVWTFVLSVRRDFAGGTRER